MQFKKRGRGSLCPGRTRLLADADVDEAIDLVVAFAQSVDVVQVFKHQFAVPVHIGLVFQVFRLGNRGVGAVITLAGVPALRAGKAFLAQQVVDEQRAGIRAVGVGADRRVDVVHETGEAEGP